MIALLAGGGVILLMATVADSVSTLLVGRGLTARWRPTRVFYDRSWWLWRRIGRTIKSPLRRERFLAAFGPLSLLALLVIWLTGLMLGWALIYRADNSATVDGADRRAAYFMYRRGRRALREVCLRLHVEGPDGPGVDRSLFDFAYQRLATSGLALRDPDESWHRLQEYRATYAGSLQALIDHLLAPAGFWGHSAEDIH